MGAVVALIAVLMVMLSGLSVGLVRDGVSGLQKLPVTSFAFDGRTARLRVLPQRGDTDDGGHLARRSPVWQPATPFGNTLVNARSDRDGTGGPGAVRRTAGRRSCRPPVSDGLAGSTRTGSWSSLTALDAGPAGR